MTKTERLLMLGCRLENLGIASQDVAALLKIERTLSRWSERECGDENGNAIERDETTGKPYATYYGSFSNGARRRHPIADKERGALKRLAAIMARYPRLWSYHQGDPRGCALYVGRKADVKGGELDSLYTRGVAVCL